MSLMTLQFQAHTVPKTHLRFKRQEQKKTLILIHKPTGDHKKQIPARINGKMEISSTLHVGFFTAVVTWQRIITRLHLPVHGTQW